MANTFPMFLLSLCLFSQFFLAKCSIPLSPALYVFGDSIVDSGNNDFLNTSAKANYKPYGIDFPAGPTGRFTNGNTFADFLAKYLGLPFVPPYLGLSKDQKSETITGMNYASGSAGILRKTGSAIGMNLALQIQIELFEETVKHYLPKNFKTHHELLKYLSKSIFVVDIGNNDYLNNYLQPARYNSSHLYGPVQFSGYLLKELKQSLQDIYNLGARKFLVFNIGPIGCTPALVYSQNITSGCAENLNQLVSLYNEGLPNMLQELTASLNGSTFVLGEFYQASYDLNQNPYKYGFTNRSSCCVVNSATSQCLQDVSPCKDRAKHIYWDGFHPTQHANYVFATGCFLGTTQCTPLNILELTQKH
ncbi:GDSL esterase/lipase 7-like isoform X1 [Telopea speciosissima]|uniref:GDSL esterase/lipase 7-like isoform X1 n=1 Tax=Telopea speciosissima TaxID=54955 RepID=UPI001CC66366|nr:GDSL esterase/lipase 7-like isoform X1 [Telopea speciosissima]